MRPIARRPKGIIAEAEYRRARNFAKAAADEAHYQMYHKSGHSAKDAYFGQVLEVYAAALNAYKLNETLERGFERVAEEIAAHRISMEKLHREKD